MNLRRVFVLMDVKLPLCVHNVVDNNEKAAKSKCASTTWTKNDCEIERMVINDEKDTE